MASQVVIEYKAELGKLKAQLKEMEGKLEDVENAAGDADKKIEGLNKTGSSLLSTFKNLGVAAGVAFGVREIMQFTREAVALAGKMQGVEAAFNRIGDAKLLDGLRQATRGTVSDLQLMQQAVRASNFEIPLQQLGSLFEFARRRAKETGEEVDYLVESIILGIGRKSPLILDNLGISAVKLRQELSGVSAEAATVGEVAEVVGRIATEALNQMGVETETVADKQQRLRAELQNLTAQIGERLLPVASSITQTFIDIGTAIGNLIGLQQRQSDATQAEYERLNVLVEALALTNTGEQERQTLIAEINKIHPTFLQGITDEEINSGKLRDRLKEVNEQYIAKIALMRVDEGLEDQQQKMADIVNDRFQRRLKVIELINRAEREYSITIDRSLDLAGQYEQAMAGLEDASNGLGIALNPSRRLLKDLQNAYTGVVGSVTNLEARYKFESKVLEQLKQQRQDLYDQLVAEGLIIEEVNEETGGSIPIIKELTEEEKKRLAALIEMSNQMRISLQTEKEYQFTLDESRRLLEQVLTFEDSMYQARDQMRKQNEQARQDDFAKFEEQSGEELKLMQQRMEAGRQMYIDLGMSEAEYTQYSYDLMKQRADALLFEGALTQEQYDKIISAQKLVLESTQENVAATMVQLFEGLGVASTALIDLLNQQNEAGSLSAAFSKTLALFNLGVQSAEAIAYAIKAAFKSPTAVTLPQKIAYIAVATGTVLNNISRARQLMSNDAPQPPKFERGGVVGGKSHADGGTMIEAEKGEFIINRRDAAANKDILKAINTGNLSKYVVRHYVEPLTRSMAAEKNSLADNIAASLAEQMGMHGNYLRKISKGKVEIVNADAIAKAMRSVNINRFKV